MKRDAIDFEKEKISVLFRKLLIPTLWGTISLCAVTAIDGIFVGYYQSIEKIKSATLLVFLRGFALLIPSFLLLPKLFGTIGIWLAMPMAEFTTTIVIALLFLVQHIRRG